MPILNEAEIEEMIETLSTAVLMRYAQERQFRYPGPENLITAKDLEKAFDKKAHDILNKVRNT